ncbi:superoxide dismutase [Phlyctema vagabunda]|uniref:Superoxide dismutase n=1 Tax=Phlyctema vagabunda TaxID=108571 RepID=A0ABR4P829_9HELO
MSSINKYALQPLGYAYDALEPYISKDIMTLHHTKHHQAYVTNLNNFLQMQHSASSSGDLVKQLSLQPAINFHAGGHINHTLFWENLSPASSSSSSSDKAPKVTLAINARWGSLSSFQEKFNAVLLSLKGSGWGWLVQDVESGSIEIITSRDQDIVPAGKKPLLGVDFWEHAYYLQYLNDKAAYANGIWKVVNWEVVEKRYLSEIEGILGELVGLKAGL